MYILYLLSLILSLCFIKHKLTRISKNIFIFGWFVSFVLIGTFAYFTDDYPSYESLVKEIISGHEKSTHIEKFWVDLIYYFKGNLTLFRFSSFACMSIVIWMCGKVAKINFTYIVCYYTLLCSLSDYTWVRQPLAMAVFMLGLLLIIRQKYFWAIAFIGLSYFLHKIVILLIPFILFLKIPVNRRFLLLYIPILAIMTSIFNYVLSNDMFGLGLIAKLYLEGDTLYVNRNSMYIIVNSICLICEFIYIIYTIYNYHNTNNKVSNYLIRYMVGLMLFVAMLLMLPLETSVVYSRILAFVNFSLVFIWARQINRDLFKYRNLELAIPLLTIIILSQSRLIANNHKQLYILFKLW